MNEFDIHVGRVNECYREVWGNINFLTQPQGGPNLRSILLKATQDVSYSRDLYESLEEYTRRYPEVEYLPSSGSPIRLDNDTRWSVDTWLISHDRFEYNGNVYEWAPEIKLTLRDDHFDTFFSLKWRAVDVMQGDAFLAYQQQGNWSDIGDFVRYLRKLVIKHQDVLPSSKFNELIEQYEKLSKVDQFADETNFKTVQIKLPKVPSRRNDDGKTALSQRETVWFFSYLRQAEIILKDNSYLIESNVHKAIQVLTGYSDTNMRKAEVSASLSKTELKNLRRLINKIGTLIDIELASKKDHKK